MSIQRLVDELLARAPEAEVLAERARAALFPDAAAQVDLLTVIVALASIQILAAKKLTGDDALVIPCIRDITGILHQMACEGEKLENELASKQGEN